MLIQPTRLDTNAIPDLVNIDGSDSDDDPDDVEDPILAPATPPTHQYETRAQNRTSARTVWDHRTGGARTLHTKATPRTNSHSTILRTSLQSALRDPRIGEAAHTALDKELLSLHNKGVFRPLRKGKEKTGGYKKPIYSHMFMKEKFHPDRLFDKLKGRLVGWWWKYARSLTSVRKCFRSNRLNTVRIRRC